MCSGRDVFGRRDVMCCTRTGEQLGQNAPERPDVDRRRVLGAEHDFGRAVEARLDVRVDALVLVARRAEVDHFDAGPALLLEQHVLGLEVAVDDAVAVQELETLEDRVRELAHEQQREALELVLLDQLVQVHREQLERDAHVRAEREVLEQVHHVVRAVAVLPPQVLEDPDLLGRLPREALLVAHDLQRDLSAVAVVEALEHLAERALPEHLQDLRARVRLRSVQFTVQFRVQ